MKHPKESKSAIRDKINRRVLPRNLHKVEFAIDGDNVTFRFNGTQTVTMPQSVIIDIYNKIHDDKHNSPE